MRVWHVSDGFAPTVGGIEVHVQALARQQQEHGDQVTVVTLTPDPEGRADADLLVRRLTSARTGQPLPLGPHRIGGLAEALRLLVREGRPDVMHVHASVVSPLAAAAIKVATSERVPAVVTVHSMWEGVGPLPWLARHGLRLPQAPVVWTAVSTPAARALAPVVAPARVHVLPNAVDPREWVAAPARERDEVHLVAVMRLTRVKRSLPLGRVLRDVRRQVPDDVALRVSIAGDGPRRAALQRYLDRHEMGWVRLLGAQDRAGVHRLVAGADLFLAPAHRESFGIAALEARAAGVPVVAPRRSGVSEFVTDEVGGLLAEDDRDLARQVARLCSDASLRHALAEHNRTSPVEHDWERARRGADVLYRRAEALTAGRRVRPRTPQVVG